MLDPEARTLLDLMDQATQAGRPRLESLPYKEGRAAVDKMSAESEAEPLAVGRDRQWQLRRAGRRDPLPALRAAWSPPNG